MALTEEVPKANAFEKPQAYDLNQPAEFYRLMREVHGYLHTCHYKHGTDWDGRKYAMDALDALVSGRATPPAGRSSGPKDASLSVAGNALVVLRGIADDLRVPPWIRQSINGALAGLAASRGCRERHSRRHPFPEINHHQPES